MATPIAAIPQLAPYVPALEALGYTDLEHVAYVSQVAGPELARYLGVPSMDAVLAAVPMAAAAIPAAATAAMQRGEYSLGVALDLVPRLNVVPRYSIAAAAGAGVAAPAALPPNCNLAAGMPAVRNQGSRGTCVAHAALAAYEHFLNAAGALQDLSEQYLYWDCKRQDGYPNSEGTWLGVAFPCLHNDGCCTEADWNYNPGPMPGNEGQGPPPPAAMWGAPAYRLASFQQLPPTSVHDIQTALASGKCVAFSIPVFNSWYRNPMVAHTGDIINPIPGEVRVGGHAMCMVGYEDLPDPGLGGGRFLLRNSWNATWGLTAANGPGYGTIPYSYIARFGTEAFYIG